MFNLIATVVSISLVALLAAATVWMGGNVYTLQQAKGSAQALTNQASQIYAASVLYRNATGGWPSQVSVLVPEYLSTPPTAPREALRAAQATPLDALIPSAYAAGASQWELLHDAAGNLAYIKLTGDSLGSTTCKAVELVREGGSVFSAVLDNIQIPTAINPAEVYQCAPDSPDATALTYFWKVPGATEAQACAALSAYNADKGTNFQCGAAPEAPPPGPTFPDIPSTCTVEFYASSTVDAMGLPSDGYWGLAIPDFPATADISQSSIQIGNTSVSASWYYQEPGYAEIDSPDAVPGLPVGTVPIYVFNNDGSVCRGTVTVVDQIFQVLSPNPVLVAGYAPEDVTFTGTKLDSPGLSVRMESYAGEEIRLTDLPFQVLSGTEVRVTIPLWDPDTASDFWLEFSNAAGETVWVPGWYDPAAAVASFTVNSYTPATAYAFSTELITIEGQGFLTPPDLSVSVMSSEPYWGDQVSDVPASATPLSFTEVLRTDTAIVLEVAHTGLPDGAWDGVGSVLLTSSQGNRLITYSLDVARVASINPSVVPPGGNVEATIAGRFFSPNTTAVFGGLVSSRTTAPAGVEVPLQNVHCSADGLACTATVTIPPYAAEMGGDRGHIAVTAARDGYYGDGQAYVGYESVALTSVSPALSHMGGQVLTLVGARFTPASTVTIDGVSVPTTFVSSTLLRVVSPALPTKIGQSVRVEVSDPDYGVAFLNQTVANSTAGYLMVQFTEADGFVTDGRIYQSCTTDGGATTSTHPYILGNFTSSGTETYSQQVTVRADRHITSQKQGWSPVILAYPDGPVSTVAGMYPEQVAQWYKPHEFAPVHNTTYTKYNGSTFSVNRTGLTYSWESDDPNASDTVATPMLADGSWTCIRASGITKVAITPLAAPISDNMSHLISTATGSYYRPLVGEAPHAIPTTRQGNVKALKLLLGSASFLLQQATIEFATPDMTLTYPGANNSQTEYGFGATYSKRTQLIARYGAGDNPYAYGDGIMDGRVYGNMAQKVRWGAAWYEQDQVWSHYWIMANDLPTFDDDTCYSTTGCRAKWKVTPTFETSPGVWSTDYFVHYPVP